MLSVYKMKVQYGRGEMCAKTLVAANSMRTARRLARADAPVPCHDSDVTGRLIENLGYRTDEPVVICRLQ